MKVSIAPLRPASASSYTKRIGVLLLFAAVSLCSAQPTLADPAGTLIQPRSEHTATRLRDGRVLLAGGLVLSTGGSVVATNSCEIYDPATNTWTATGSLNVPRSGHKAVLLADGRVLVAGGSATFPPKTVEIYDPVSGSWSFTQSLLNVPGGDLVLLADGRVLAPGGIGQKGGNCELYNPGTGKWSPTGSLNLPRDRFQATRLDDGRVLAVGGVSPTLPGYIRQCELYDPVTGTWSLSGTLNQPHGIHAQVLLADGRVLIAGGLVGPPCCSTVTRIAEIFDPNTAVWSLTHPLTTPRVGFTANLLDDGNVFAAGGTLGESNQTLDSIEEFETATGRWHLLSITLATPRLGHTAITLLDGSVLIAGGVDAQGLLIPDAEIFVTPR